MGMGRSHLTSGSMSISRDSVVFNLIEVGIRSNFTIVDSNGRKREAYMLCSTNHEGDSQIGVIMFAGLAVECGIVKNEVIDKLNIEFEDEFMGKLEKYHTLLGSDKRFKNKRGLVLNRIVWDIDYLMGLRDYRDMVGILMAIRAHAMQLRK